ncbi:hypothetical protein PENTCL1PPCAC_28721, partial [Pristionchus entomophagus]
KPTMHRIETNTFELIRVDMEYDSKFVDDLSTIRKCEPVVHEDKVYLSTSTTLYCGSFEMDGVFYWRNVETTGHRPSDDQNEEDNNRHLSSQADKQHLSNGGHRPMFRQLYFDEYYTGDDNGDSILSKRIVMYELDIINREWTKRMTETTSEEGSRALEY